MTGNGEPLLRLHSPQHQEVMLASLEECYQQQQQTDIVLICGSDCQVVKAHRIVLSSSSDYLKKIIDISLELKFNYPIIPLIVLKEIPFSDVKAIIDFIYTGRMVIPKSQLDSLSRSCKMLEINGLQNLGDKKPTDENCGTSKAGQQQPAATLSNSCTNTDEFTIHAPPKPLTALNGQLVPTTSSTSTNPVNVGKLCKLVSRKINGQPMLGVSFPKCSRFPLPFRVLNNDFSCSPRTENSAVLKNDHQPTTENRNPQPIVKPTISTNVSTAPCQALVACNQPDAVHDECIDNALHACDQNSSENSLEAQETVDTGPPQTTVEPVTAPSIIYTITKPPMVGRNPQPEVSHTSVASEDAATMDKASELEPSSTDQPNQTPEVLLKDVKSEPVSDEDMPGEIVQPDSVEPQKTLLEDVNVSSAVNRIKESGSDEQQHDRLINEMTETTANNPVTSSKRPASTADGSESKRVRRDTSDEVIPTIKVGSEEEVELVELDSD